MLGVVFLFGLGGFWAVVLFSRRWEGLKSWLLFDGLDTKTPGVDLGGDGGLNGVFAERRCVKGGKEWMYVIEFRLGC